MTRPLLAALAMTLILSGCATISRFNPFGWFGSARSGPAMALPEVVDNRPLVAQVTRLMIERTSTGAIVRAEGLTPTQGWWAGELVPQTSLRPLDGVIVYQFRIAPPPAETRISTPQSRSVTVASTLTQDQLDAIRQVVVVGAGNQLTVSR
jgi:hypothetical protein